MQKKYAMLLLFVLSWHVPLKVVAYPACSHTKVMQVAKIGGLVCVAGVAPYVLAKPAFIFLTRPVATCILSIPHKFPFELVGFCEGVDHDYYLGFGHPSISSSTAIRALFRLHHLHENALPSSSVKYGQSLRLAFSGRGQGSSSVSFSATLSANSAASR